MKLFKSPDIENLERNRDIRSLIKALHYRKNEMIRSNAARALGHLKDNNAVLPLLDILEEIDEKINPGQLMKLHVAVIYALGEIGATQSVDTLIRRLNKKWEWQVRLHAIDALGLIGDPKAIQPLVNVLNTPRKYDNWVRIRDAAISALERFGQQLFGQLGPIISHPYCGNEVSELLKRVRAKSDDSKSEIEILIANKDLDKCIQIGKPAVENLIKFLPDPFVADALAKIGDKRAIKPLGKCLLLNAKPYAAKNLAEFGDQQAIDSLIQGLKHDAANVRSASADALGQIEGVQKKIETIDPLIESMLQFENCEIPKLLEIIGTQEAIDVLVKDLKRKDQTKTLWASAKALMRLGDKTNAHDILELLFEYINPSHFLSRDDLVCLFDDYSNIIFRLTTFEVEKRMTSPGTIGDTWIYSLDKNKEALEELVNIQSNISNNLLLKVSNMKDIKVISSWSPDEGSEYKILDYNALRDTAEKELNKRGQPAYNSQIYSVQNEWIV